MRAFRVFPEQRALFWTVRVFPSLREMRAAHAAFRGEVNRRTSDGSSLAGAGKALAVVCGTTTVNYVKGKARTHPSLGEIFLCERHLGGGVLAHEATHAMRYYFDRMKLPLEGEEADERSAQVVGEIVRQIARRVW